MDEEGDAGASTCSESEKVDSSLIKKILCQMKSEFNRSGGEGGGTPLENGGDGSPPSPPTPPPPPQTPPKNEEKERIVLTLRKEEPVSVGRPRRRGPRKRQTDLALKRSSRRRMSKELTRESVLQSAIALKEKSFSSLNDDKPNRRSARLVEPPPTTAQRPKSSRRSIGKLVRLTSDLDSSKSRVDDEPLDIDDDTPSYFEASFRTTKRLADKWSDTESVAKKSMSHSSDSNSLGELYFNQYL
jgi:type IV secretory pathway VirB10-like protein